MNITRALYRRPWTLLLAIIVLMVSASVAVAKPTSGELAAMQRKQAVAEAEARQEIESLFTRLCPGRCELIDVKAIVATPKAVGEVTPGFDSVGSATFETELKRVEARVMIDSNLPNNFRSNIPAMLRYRLSSITPNVVITPTILEFPQPQNPPMPPILRDPPRRPPQPIPQPRVEEPKPKEEPKAEPKKPEEVKPKVEEKEKPWYAELWKEMLPWIPFILMLLIFFALFMSALRRMRETLDGNATPVVDGEDIATDGAVEAVDADRLRQDLKESRAVQNDVLRQWLQQDPEAVATLVRLIGPDVLDDLKQDSGLRPMIEVVSQEVARQSDPVPNTEGKRIERETRSRIMAAKVLQANKAMSGDWEFLQGISVANLQRVMGPLNAQEKSYVLGQLPPALRASYMNQMNAKDRRALFLSAGGSDMLSKEQAMDLAVRVRKSSDDLAHIGAEASGQAMIIVEMLRALALGEQTDTLRELSQKRPEVAQAVFDQVCLESTLLHAPSEVVADAMLRTSVDMLSKFLRGTEDQIAQKLLDVAPNNVRGPLRSEYELEIPVSRSEYLDARTEFTTMVATVLRRDGHDLASLNAQAIRHPQGPREVDS